MRAMNHNDKLIEKYEQPDRLELDKQEILDKIKEIEDLVKNLR